MIWGTYKGMWAMGVVTLVAMTMLTISWGSMTRGIETHSRLLLQTGKITNTVAMLGTSARMGAATGQAHYARRYFTLIEGLERQTAATLDLFSSAYTSKMRDAIHARHDAMKAISDEASVLMGAGQTAQALAMLDTPRIRTLRDDHMTAIGTALYALHDRSSSRLRAQRMNVLSGGVVLLLIIALTLVQILRRKAVEADLRCCDAQLKTLRAAMGSAMDVQNNLLNNMVYFRTKAEMGGMLDAGDIVMIDREIEASRAKMAELCAIEDVRTRDIGGIVVLEPPSRTPNTGMAFA